MAFSSPVLRQDILSGAVFSGQIAIGDQQGIANFYNNKNGVSGAIIFRNDIQPREIINVIDPANFVAAQQIQLSKLQILFQGAPIDAQLPTLRANFASIFSGTASMSGINSIAQRQGSRGEVLFGAGVTISVSDVQQALA